MFVRVDRVADITALYFLSIPAGANVSLLSAFRCSALVDRLIVNQGGVCG